ncbi:MAG: alpha-ketoacid dehydrogenase subunit beta [Myxococcales bacterium FL481]|nr:MAG: alpha-ketoacid dehydrogenase subunit beta [Myxococcales bacterium FL481]
MPSTARAHLREESRDLNDTSPSTSRVLNGAQAILEATTQALEQDPRVFVLGEGVTDPKGVFGTTKDLVDRFGRQRICEMPVAENGWTGMAIGAAMCGQRPILVHQRVEFALLAFEQLANNAAKAHYVTGGRHRVPLVVRLVVGRGWGQGPMHSQCLEGVFAQIPGLKVALPATADDAKGLLLGAIADDSPVVIIEHRWIHYATGVVESAAVPRPLDGPQRRHQGDALTVVSSSYMTLETLRACQALSAHGVDVDLFDLRVARPLALDGIVESVRRTGRLLTIDTGHREFGLGAEIVATVCQHALHSLQAPPRRMGLPSHPTPSSAALAGAYYPRSPEIAVEIAELVGAGVDRTHACVAELRAERDRLPIDVPHPSFRGPF